MDRVEIHPRTLARAAAASLGRGPASDGGLWAANHYLYRLRRFGDSGQTEVDVTLGELTAVAHLEEEAVEELRSELADRAALLGQEKVTITPFTAQPLIQDITEGRDGKIYLYLAPGPFGPEPLLDRFDPTTQRLERAVLGLDHPGRVTLAAGRDGLWIAAVGAGRALWRIPWLTLQEIGWREVKEAHFDGLPRRPEAAP